MPRAEVQQVEGEKVFIEPRLVGILASLGSAVFFASAQVFVRMGLRNSDPFSAYITSLIVNTAILWPPVIYTIFSTNVAVSLLAIFYFTASGLLATGVGRLFSFIGIHKMGVVEAAPLIGVSPLFIALLAILVLNESMTFFIALGTALTVLGITMITGVRIRGARLLGIIISLSSSLFLALGHFLKKLGLNETPSPTLGSALSVVAPLSLAYLYLNSLKRSRNFKINTNKFFIFSGVLQSVALLLQLLGYQLVKLVVASPIANSVPLWTLLITHVVLKEERVRLRHVLSTLIIITGLSLIVIE